MERMIEIVVIPKVDAHYVCSIQQGRQTRALWGISWHYWMCEDIVDVSH
jgi:hypothetical protein